MSSSTDLVYPLTTPDRLGGVTEVAPGVLWVRMPLDDRLNHINVWLLADGEGWTLVDTGINSEETRALWERVLVEYVRGPLKRIICTHYHPDHVGLAGWLHERTGADIWMTAGELAAARHSVQRPTPEEQAAAHAFFAGFSTDADAVRRQGEFWKLMASMIHPLPETVRLIVEPTTQIGEHEWRVIIGRGHAPEHACLYCESLQLLIAGDQVLPGITSNVSVDPLTPDADPVRLFVESCETLAQLPADTWVLPSHRNVFVGLHRRLDALVAAVERRLDLIVDTCAEPADADHILAALYPGALNELSWRLAVGEMAAYLNRLLFTGRLERIEAEDGAPRWRAIAPAAALS